jgi:photosystem II stability/assembly factor-like uncharacterized protein
MGRCLKSGNGGLLWSNLSIPSWSWLTSVWATSPDVVHIGAWDTIYNSMNGGQNWNPVYINTVNYQINDLQFHSASLGYAFLQASAFIKTTDGGNTWSNLFNAGVIDDYLAGFMFDETNGWAVGGAGMITYTNDGGQTWWQYDWNNWTEWSPLDIEGVYFTSAMNGFAVADSGVLFRTTNGGLHWDKYYIAGPEDRLKDIFFLNENLGWIVGYHGIIFATTDGGENWYMEPSLTTHDLNAVFFISADLGWVVGSNGTILRFSSSSSAIGDHSLLQERNVSISPNPSVSGARLRLDLSQEMAVSAVIYDYSGRMIDKLFSGTLSMGTHTFVLDDSGLPAGLYLCRVSCPGGQVSRPWMIQR